MSDIWTQFGESIIKIGPKIPGVIVYFLAGYLVIKLIISLIKKALRLTQISKALSNIITSMVVVILWVILFSELAQEVGLSSLAVKISGSLLVVGLAIANGISTLAGDIMAGIYLSNDKDFDCGMRIRSGDIEGVIKKIDIRKTRIEDNEGRLHIVPNSRIDTGGWSVLNTENPKS